MSLTIHFADSTRRCGDCQLCCKLVPVKGLGKPAGRRCIHQRAGKGCVVHDRLKFVSPSCAIWSCQWLANHDTADLKRPDRSHYVIDPLPDYVTITQTETGKREHHEVVQIWVDPDYPDAHRDPALRAFLERQGKVGLVRYDNTRGFSLFPPATAADGQWHEMRPQALNQEEEHSLDDVARALAGAG